MRSPFLITTLVLGALIGSRPPAEASEVRLASVESSCAVVGLFERCELTVRLAGAVADPYDPDEVTLEATFRPAGGEPVIVQGFFYQPFVLSGANGRELLQAEGEPVWKIRFTPQRLGRWSYEVRLVTPAGAQAFAGEPFLVVQSPRRGFVRLDRERRNFRFDTGAPFIPIGESLCWGSRRQYEQWFRDLARQRANYIRVWLAPWSLGLETAATGVGRYDQARAWLLDRLLEQSEAAGLYWQLCLLDHRSFSQDEESDWSRNPYHAQQGGMCRLPNEFLTHPDANAAFQRLLRYLVNRWGYSPQLAVWELFNEADLADFAPEDLAAWTGRMSAFLRAIDRQQRPITTSFYEASPEAVWRLPAIDIVQLHRYDERDFAPSFTSPEITRLAETFQKPVLVGEFGWTDEPMRRLDDIGIHFHDGLWASLMGGSAGTGLIWYWDSYVHPQGLERHFRALEMFWRGEQLGGPLGRVAVSSSDADVVGWALGTAERTYFWLKNRTHTVDRYVAYRCELAKERLRVQRGEPARPVAYEPRMVRGATVTVEGLAWSGRYRMEWWDPYRGNVAARSVHRSQQGAVTVDLPPLAFDVAGKLIKLQWWERS
ncbi:MAG: DUF5060 domain-containing protein [Candidatus Omnitrophica bacterium]|nr:DUF5060 domain-containing protein [Candidatus Omnitrophota bacterium]